MTARGGKNASSVPHTYLHIHDHHVDAVHMTSEEQHFMNAVQASDDWHAPLVPSGGRTNTKQAVNMEQQDNARRLLCGLALDDDVTFILSPVKKGPQTRSHSRWLYAWSRQRSSQNNVPFLGSQLKSTCFFVCFYG